MEPRREKAPPALTHPHTRCTGAGGRERWNADVDLLKWKRPLLILPCLPGVILQLGDLKTGSPSAINTADVHQRTPDLG